MYFSTWDLMTHQTKSTSSKTFQDDTTNAYWYTHPKLTSDDSAPQADRWIERKINGHCRLISACCVLGVQLLDLWNCVEKMKEKNGSLDRAKIFGSFQTWTPVANCEPSVKKRTPPNIHPTPLESPSEQNGEHLQESKYLTIINHAHKSNYKYHT